MARPHPYNFAHVLLPQLAWRRPNAVRRELSDPYLARELLKYMWAKAGEELPVADQLPQRGLHVGWHEVAGRATALFQLPAPQALTEAYFSVLVYEEDDETPEDEDDELRPRYFTLEATLAKNTGEAGSPTLIGEWTGDFHRHLGRGPAAGLPGTAVAFLQAVANVLGPLPGSEVPLMHIVR